MIVIILIWQYKMNGLSNIFGRGTSNNVFAPNNTNSIIKKGQLPGHTNATSNIFSANTNTAINTNAPLQQIFTRQDNPIGGPAQQNIFGQINAANKNASGFQGNSGVSPFQAKTNSGNTIFQGNPQGAQLTSPFAQTQNINPLQSQQANGIFKLPVSQGGNNSPNNFANLFNQGAQGTQGNKLTGIFTSQQKPNTGIFAQNNGVFGNNNKPSSTGIFNQGNQQTGFPFQQQAQSQQPNQSFQQGQPYQSFQQQSQPFQIFQEQNQPQQANQSFQHQSTAGIFPFLQQGQGQQQPTSTNIFGQPNAPQQFQGIPQADQLQGNTQAALSNYLQQYQQQLSQRKPFSMQQAPQQAQPGGPQPKFNPKSHDHEYYLFLNNLIRDDNVRSHGTQRQLSNFASAWADSNLLSTHAQQIRKLFNAEDLYCPGPLQQKDLPPIQITEELLESMNDPLQAKLMLSELFRRCKNKADDLVFSMLGHEAHLGSLNMKVKDVTCFRQMAIMWTQLKALSGKVGEMVDRARQIDKTKQLFRKKVEERCRLFKECFVEVTRNQSMVEQANKQIEQLTGYLSRHLQPIVKALANNTSPSFEDPDPSILAIATTLLHKVSYLDESLSHYFSQAPSNEAQLDAIVVTQNLCEYYQQVAEQLFEVNQKIRKCVNLASRQSYKNGEEVMRRIRSKASQVITKKLDTFYKINEIQYLLAERKRKDLQGDYDDREPEENAPRSSRSALMHD